MIVVVVVVVAAVLLNVTLKQNDQLLVKHMHSSPSRPPPENCLQSQHLLGRQTAAQAAAASADTEMFGSLPEQPSASNTINKALSACVSSSQKCGFAFAAVTSPSVYPTVDQVHVTKSIESAVGHSHYVVHSIGALSSCWWCLNSE